MVALLTLDAAKQHLRVDHTDDDADIQAKIEEATEIVLSYIKKTIAPPPLPDGGVVGVLGVIEDGSATVAQPNWQKLTFASASGTAGVVENGDLRMSIGGNLAFDLQISVTHNQNRTVILGSSIDGGAVVELTRVKVGAQPAWVVQRTYQYDEPAGALIAIHISSDGTQAPVGWTAGELMILETQPPMLIGGGEEVDWTPATVPRPVKAAIEIMLSKLYDDRNAGATDNAIAMGYLPLNVTSLLHRFRDPAIA